MILGGCKRMLLRSASVFDFCDAGAAGRSGGVSGVYGFVMNIVFGIENYGEDAILLQAEIDAEVVADFWRRGVNEVPEENKIRRRDCSPEGWPEPAAEWPRE